MIEKDKIHILLTGHLSKWTFTGTSNKEFDSFNYIEKQSSKSILDIIEYYINNGFKNVYIITYEINFNDNEKKKLFKILPNDNIILIESSFEKLKGDNVRHDSKNGFYFRSIYPYMESSKNYWIKFLSFMPIIKKLENKYLDEDSYIFRIRLDMIPEINKIINFKIGNKILCHRYWTEVKSNKSKISIQDYFHFGKTNIIINFFNKLEKECNKDLLIDFYDKDKEKYMEHNIIIRYISSICKDENIKIENDTLKKLIREKFCFLYDPINIGNHLKNEKKNNPIICPNTKTIFNETFCIYWIRKAGCYHNHWYSQKSLCKFFPFTK